jgi:hypothetical protein
MSGVLESLASPLERLSVLPTTVSLRVNPVTNSPVWNALIQYYKNDLVISSVDGGAWIMTGGSSDQSVVRGGLDPAVSPTDLWQKLAADGAPSFEQLATTFAVAGAGVITVTNGVLVAVSPGSVWQGVLSYVSTYAAPIVDGDIISWTAASNGTGGTSDSEDVVPLVGASTQRGSVQFRVSAGANPPAQLDISLTAQYSGAQPTTLTGSIAWSRLA